MENKFTVINHDYINTGGNTMVSIFTVYAHLENTTRYVIIGDDQFSLQTADTVTNGALIFDNEDLFKKIVIGCWPLDCLIAEDGPNRPHFTNEEYELFKYCEFEHYKKDCKHYDYQQRVSTNQLPTELYWKLSLDYREWADREGVGCLTDGYDVFMDSSYDPPYQPCDEAALDESDEKLLQEVKEFSQWLKKFDYDAISFDSYIGIAVAGQCTKIPLHADSYDLLDNFVDKVIENF